MRSAILATAWLLVVCSPVLRRVSCSFWTAKFSSACDHGYSNSCGVRKSQRCVACTVAYFLFKHLFFARNFCDVMTARLTAWRQARQMAFLAATCWRDVAEVMQGLCSCGAETPLNACSKRSHLRQTYLAGSLRETEKNRRSLPINECGVFSLPSEKRRAWKWLMFPPETLSGLLMSRCNVIE